MAAAEQGVAWARGAPARALRNVAPGAARYASGRRGACAKPERHAANKATDGADGGGRTRTALRPRDFKSLASTGFATSAWSALLSHFAAKMNLAAFVVGDRRLKGEAHIPREVDPRVLGDLGDEGVDQGAPQGFGVDGGEMCFGQHLAHQLGGGAGVDQVVDDQD